MYEELVKQLRDLPHLLFVQLHGHENIVYESADTIEELSDTLKAYQDGTDMVVEEVPGKMTIRFVEKWIPVTERVPNPNVDVLVCTNGDISVDKYFGLVLGKPAFLKKSYRVTHWMPLPKAPELSKEEE